MATNPNNFTMQHAMQFAQAAGQNRYAQAQQQNAALNSLKFQQEQAAYSQLDPTTALFARTGLVDQSNFLPYQNQRMAEQVMQSAPQGQMSGLDILRLSQGLGGDPGKAQELMALQAQQQASAVFNNPTDVGVLTKGRDEYRNVMKGKFRGTEAQLNAVAMMGKPFNELTPDEQQEYYQKVSSTTFNGIAEKTLSNMTPEAQVFARQLQYTNPELFQRVMFGATAGLVKDTEESGAKVEAERQKAGATQAYREATLGNQQTRNQISQLTAQTGVAQLGLNQQNQEFNQQQTQRKQLVSTTAAQIMQEPGFAQKAAQAGFGSNPADFAQVEALARLNGASDAQPAPAGAAGAGGTVSQNVSGQGDAILEAIKNLNLKGAPMR